MARTIPIDNLARGVQNDNPQPGTLRECVNLLPWRGALRRRGPILRDSAFTDGGTSIGLADAHYASQLRPFASDTFGELGPRAIYGNRVAGTATSTTRYYVEGKTGPIKTGLPPLGRFVDAGGQLLMLPDLAALSATYLGARLASAKLKAIWMLNETSGTTADNAQGTAAYDGTYTGGFTLDQSGPRTGVRSVALNGSTGYVSMSVNTGYLPTLSPDNLTFECWIKLDSVTSGTHTIVDCVNSNRGWRLQFVGSGGGQKFRLAYGDNSTTRTKDSGSTTLSAGEWHYVVLTLDEPNLKAYLYLNGLLADTLTLTGGIVNPTSGSLRLGATVAGADFFDGNLAACAIYAPALTVQERINLGLVGLAPVYSWNGGVQTDFVASGNVTITSGSRYATLANDVAASVKDAGYLVVKGRHYRVESVISSNKLLLADPARETYTGTDWSADTTGPYTVSDAPTGTGMFSQANAGSVGQATEFNYVCAGAGCFHQGRMFFGNLREYEWASSGASLIDKPTAFRWSDLDDAQDSQQFAHMRRFNSDAIESLPSEGGAILGMVSLNGALVFLRRQSVDVATGAFATDGSDIGASLNTVARNIGAAGARAWETFEGGVAFADEKGVYVWDGSQVTNITRGAIEQVYRAAMEGVDPSRIIVNCPGNRIMVWVSDSSSVDAPFVYDIGVGGWFRLQFDGIYSRIVETGTKMLAMRAGSVAGAARSYNFRGVFEGLQDGEQDEDAGDHALECYLLTNPIPLADGWQQGRVSHVGLMDGGACADADDVTYELRLLRGSIYSGDPLSGDANLASQALSETKDVPPLVSEDVDQRSVLVRVDGSNDASHVMVELRHAAGDADVEFLYGISTIGLVVEDNPNFPSA